MAIVESNKKRGRELTPAIPSGFIVPMISQLETYLEKYDQVVEEYRKNHDFMWRIFAASERRVLQNYLRDLVRSWRSMYGMEQSRFKLPPQVLDVFEWVVERSEDINLMHALWFFGLYLNPPFCQYFLQGDPVNGNPPPPMNHPGRFKFYISRVLPNMCENLLSGLTHTSIRSFVREARTEYVAINALPEPPMSMRAEHDERAKKHRSESGRNAGDAGASDNDDDNGDGD
jgi:hypothetical protein